MHEHVSKHVKMQRKPTDGINKYGILASHGAEKGKGMNKTTGIKTMPPKWLHPNKALWASDVTTQTQTR